MPLLFDADNDVGSGVVENQDYLITVGRLKTVGGKGLRCPTPASAFLGAKNTI
jgi:hypothetical protein